LVESREIRRWALLDRQLGVKINDKPYVRQACSCINPFARHDRHKAYVIHPAYTTMRIASTVRVRKRGEREKKKERTVVVFLIRRCSCFRALSVPRNCYLNTRTYVTRRTRASGRPRRKLELWSEGNGESSGWAGWVPSTIRGVESWEKFTTSS